MNTIAMPQGTRVLLPELIANAEKEILRQHYSEGTVHGYRLIWKKLMEYADTQPDGEYFSEDLGARFIREVYGFYPEMPINSNPQQYRHKRRAIRILGDLQLHGIVLRHEMSDVVPWPTQFEPIMLEYMEYLHKCYLSEMTVKTKAPHLKRFSCYLNEMQVSEFQRMTHEHISGFAATLGGYHPKTYSSFMVTIRRFLRYLFQNNIIEKDLSLCVPSVTVWRNTDIPTTWSSDEIEKLIASIDRSTKTGKRDYAAIMLAVRLGIRAGDIRDLKLGDIHWEKAEICFTQSKTNKPVSLPLDNETGWAVIDYLQHARPKSEYNNVFIRLRAPYVPYGPKYTFYDVINKYFIASDITIPKEKKHGIHSLRHSLASALLEAHTPLPTISAILGHSDYSSTMTYLKTDVNGLRQCALDPEVLCDER